MTFCRKFRANRYERLVNGEITCPRGLNLDNVYNKLIFAFKKTMEKGFLDISQEVE